MPFSIKYSKSRRLIVSGLCCDCPFEHRAITQDIYIGPGVLEGLAAMVKRRDMGTRLVLVADEGAYERLGERVTALLSASGYAVTPAVINARAMPNETDVGQALLSMRMDTDFFVSLGAGCITDITRVVASQTERPMACIATAASTTAYPSVAAKSSLKGFVSSMRTVCPEIVVCDTDIISKAPQSTLAAGFAEMMSEYTAVTDWRLARLINCDKLCPTYAEAVLFAADRTLAEAEAIARGSEKGVQTLMESLILSGLVIAMTGSARAVESSEHAIADGVMMEYMKTGERMPDYYRALGEGVKYCFERADRVRALAGAAVDADKLAAFDLEGELIAGLGPNALMAARRFPDTSKAFVSRQLGAFVKRFASVKNALGDIPEGKTVVAAMEKVGCFSGCIDTSALARACRYAPYITGSCGLAFLERLMQ